MKQKMLDMIWDQTKGHRPRTCKHCGKKENEAPHRPTVDAKGRIQMAPKCGSAQWYPLGQEPQE